jgi:hypothetical protein
MRPVRYSAQLALKLEPKARRAVEMLAEKERTSLGEAARALLDEGIRSMKIESARCYQHPAATNEDSPRQGDLNNDKVYFL